MKIDKNGLQSGILRAQARGLKVVEPQANQLQIDLDSARALRRYGQQYALLRREGLTKGWKEKITPSRKRGHVHVTITMPHINGCECLLPQFNGPGAICYCYSLLHRICLEAILGSDLTREAFNYCRAVRGDKYPIVFFEAE